MLCCFGIVQTFDYPLDDELLINISNIFGDDYDKFIQTESVLFEVWELFEFDMLNFEIKNNGSRMVSVIVMFLEDPETLIFFLILIHM